MNKATYTNILVRGKDVCCRDFVSRHKENKCQNSGSYSPLGQLTPKAYLDALVSPSFSPFIILSPSLTPCSSSDLSLGTNLKRKRRQWVLSNRLDFGTIKLCLWANAGNIAEDEAKKTLISVMDHLDYLGAPF